MHDHLEPVDVAEQLRVARLSRAPARNQPAPKRMLLLAHPRLSASLPLAHEMTAQLREWGIGAEIVANDEALAALHIGKGDLVVALGGGL